uniref:Uncharacterized protein n=1 Tax=Setaria italica TaxID=4555 RepID=K3ZYV5_SETIT
MIIYLSMRKYFKRKVELANNFSMVVHYTNSKQNALLDFQIGRELANQIFYRYLRLIIYNLVML